MIEVVKKEAGEKYNFEELYDIIRKLRSPEGCPWDREQTHETLIKPMIEEAYEAVDAIEKKSVDKMTEEMGDVLLQVIFHCILGEEEGAFGFLDVTDRCARKMLTRHTHVFGDKFAENADEALVNWEAAKLKEKGFDTLRQDLDDIPNQFPALMRAGKCAKKIRKADRNLPDREASAVVDNMKIDFSDETIVGRILYEICSRAEENGVDAEIALKKCTSDVIKSIE
ncbi:MAG: MazG family protein [Ruminococcaceae bacterium]|nr:MazG family protein [Oscillospiraceae bacterium]